MASVKVLLSTHSTAFLHFGGGESEMVQISDSLKRLGAEADIYGRDNRPLDFYDTALHFSVHPDGVAILQAAAAANKRIVLYPNVWHLSPPPAAEVERVQTLVELAEVLVFRSQTERAHFAQYYPAAAQKAQVIVPAGVASGFAQTAERKLLRAILPSLQNYVLCMGLIEPVKNQLALIEALNGLGLSAVFVGGIRDRAYAAQCLSAAQTMGAGGKSAHHFVPYLQPASELLRALIANASLVAEPSFDPPGRSILEALFMRRPVLLARSDWADECVGSSAFYTENYSAQAIGAALQTWQRATTDAASEGEREATALRVQAHYNEQITAQALLEVL